MTWGFTVGVLIYRRWRRGRLDWLPCCPAWLLPLLFAATCLPAYRASFVPFTAAAAVLAVFPLLTALATCAGSGRQVSSVLNWLGLLSFPVYAIHYGVLNAARAIGGGSPGVGLVAVAASCTLLASHAALRWWDEPIRARLVLLGHVGPSVAKAAPPL